MPLINLHSLKYHDVCITFSFLDDTVYGGANPARSAFGIRLISAHVDEKGIENFVTIDSTPYLSKIEYTINNTIDGHYRFELLRFGLWSSGPSYIPEVRDVNNIITTYASVVYYTVTGKFYKNIQATSTIAPDAPTGSQFWTEIITFTSSELRANTNITIGVFNDIFDCRTRKCTKAELNKVSCEDPECLDLKKMLPYLKKAVYLAGARSKNSDGQPEKSETILRTLSNLCDEC